MKKILLLLTLILISYATLDNFTVYAEQTSYAPPVPAEGVKRPPPSLEQMEEQLVDLNLPTSRRRYQDLERRVAELERQLRFQDELIRNLDRTVNDIRRRKI